MIMKLPSSLLDRKIDRGTILHSRMFDDIDHGKFFVVIGVTDDFIAGFFFINSNINRSIWGKQEQLEMQYPLRHSDYDFLKYDSFLCATNIIKRHKEHIVRSLENGETEFIGSLKKAHLNEVLCKLRKSRLFSKKEKELFFYEE